MANPNTPTTTAHGEQEIPPAMDYAAHNATFRGFTQMVKWAIIVSGITMVALYFFVIGQQPVLGAVLLLLIPAAVIAAMVKNTRRT